MIYACIDCATIYNVDPGVPPICPKCDKLLGLRREEPDKVVSFAELASWATHGLPKRRRKLWKVA